MLDDAFESVDVPVIVLEILRRGLTVRPAGVETLCRIEPYDLLQCIVPFLAYLYCLHDRRLAPLAEGRMARCLVARSAVPGAGKSVLAAVLEEFSRLLKTYPRMQVIGMDGLRFSNRELRSRCFQDESGHNVSLASRKASCNPLIYKV